MANRIFVLNNNNELIGLEEQQYDTEDLLQSLLANYPALLGSDEIGNESRRWLLVSRETPVPDMEDASGRWSLDHLFIDQDCIPTLVEVKRSTDTRIRREVVGQMLDYAANAVVHWKIDIIRAKFEAQCQQKNIDPAQMIVEQLGLEDTETFWENVRTNLLAGKIRLIFVADEIPYELKRIIEFLNKQMNPAEVLGIAIKQFVGQGMKTLVPSVIGLTAEAAQAKSGNQERQRWDEKSFFAELAQHDPDGVPVAQALLDWGKRYMPEFYWGRSMRGSFTPGKFHHGIWHQVISVWTHGVVELQFQYMQKKPPFDDNVLRQELAERFAVIEGITLREDTIFRRPNYKLSMLRHPQKFEEFINVLHWFLEQVETFEG
jgi:hypothetical protein